MGVNLSDELRRLVAERAYHVCEYCLVHESDLLHACEVDHVISVKHDGKTVMENLANACLYCNRHKGTDIGSAARGTGRFVRFHNPRTDRWSDHFFLSSGRIESLTEIGEVTARILDFNLPERVLFRRILADAGRYPTVEALARMKE